MMTLGSTLVAEFEGSAKQASENAQWVAINTDKKQNPEVTINKWATAVMKQSKRSSE